jgi:hypothetical protein
MEEEKKSRRHFTGKEIADVLTRYHQSGKSKREFCDLEGIHYSTFGNWFRSQKRKKKKRELAAGPFMKLKFPPLYSGTVPFMQLSLPGGDISFYSEPRAQFVKSLLTA